MKCCNSKKVINDLYKNIAINDRLRDSDNSKEIEKKIALSLGYTLEDIENGANLFKACKIVGEKGFVIGVDRLSEMIEKANYIREKKGFLNTDFRVSDIDNLKVESDFVDCVISNCVINLCEDKEKVYSEIFRVLKAGGRISISDIVQFNELPSWVKDESIFYATWVAGSITSEKLKSILKNVGFELYTIIEEELTEEYLAKWGHKLDLKKYIRRGKILAVKPKN